MARPSKRIGGPAGWTVNELIGGATSSYQKIDMLEAINELIDTSSSPVAKAYVHRMLVGGEKFPDSLPDDDLAMINAIVLDQTDQKLAELLEAIDDLVESPGIERDVMMKRVLVGRWNEDLDLLGGAPHWDPRCERWEVYTGDTGGQSMVKLTGMDLGAVITDLRKKGLGSMTVHEILRQLTPKQTLDLREALNALISQPGKDRDSYLRRLAIGRETGHRDKQEPEPKWSLKKNRWVGG